MSENRSPIPSRLYNAAKGGHVAGAVDIIDDDKGKTQDVINQETDSALENRYKKEETYSKTELNNLITTPSQKYVSVTATSQTTSATDVLPATGEADTIYRVGNWDGSQYDTTCYTEYAWNGSTYVKLNTKEVGIDDEPTAGSDNLVKSGGVSAAIGEILIFDGIVSYNAETWEQDIRFYNQDININADALLYYKNENSVAATCRVTYSDDSTRDIGLGANYETVGSLAKDNMTIKHIFCYFGASARPNANIKIVVLQNIGKDLYELTKNFNILKDNGYKYKGVVSSLSYSPSAPQGKEFYISVRPGTYSNFSNLVVPSYNIGLLKYDGSAWSVDLLNLSPMVNQGVLTLFNGNVSRSGSSDWDKDRNLYAAQSSWGRAIKFTIDNETGVSLSYRLTYTDGTISSSGINPSTKELNFDSDKEINEVFFYFGSNTNPEGNVKIVAYTNNFYYIEKISEYIEKIYSESVSASVASGSNVNLKIENNFKKDEEYYIQIDGSISSNFLLRGYTNGVVTELGTAYCGCFYKIIPAKDFDSIGIAKNSISEAGNVTIKLLSKSEWDSFKDDNEIKIGSVGLTNRKNLFVSGSNVLAEVVGNFKANECYEITLLGDSGNNTFLIFLFSLTNTELYRSIETYNLNKTYIFKCPVNAEKLTFVRNNVNSNVNISVNVRLAYVGRDSRHLPNFIGIPIAAHQGNTVGGETIGSPRAWIAASRLGYKWIECDIQFTSDDEPVFLHDNPINLNGSYIVSKADGTPINPSDNITVSSLTYQELTDTYRWADGGEILSLKEGFGLLNMLGMNAFLEFKAYPDNDNRKAKLKDACLQFGIERIIYIAASTDYRIIFPILINMGIYMRGVVATTSSNEQVVEAAFAYASQIGGAMVNAHGVGIDSEFIQTMMKTYGVGYFDEKWGKSNSNLQVSGIVSDELAPVKEYYSNSDILATDTDIDYTDYTSIGSVTVSKVSNVNLTMVADEGVEVKLSATNQSHAGYVNVAYIKASGTYSVFVKGSGHVTEISVRY